MTSSPRIVSPSTEATDGAFDAEAAVAEIDERFARIVAKAQPWLCVKYAREQLELSMTGIGKQTTSALIERLRSIEEDLRRGGETK